MVLINKPHTNKSNSTASWTLIKELNITDLELKERCDKLGIKMRLHTNNTGFRYCFFTSDECNQIRNYKEIIEKYDLGW